MIRIKTSICEILKKINNSFFEWTINNNKID